VSQKKSRNILTGAFVNRAMTLRIVKTNPALRLCERLGFRTTLEDENKFHMRRSCCGSERTHSRQAERRSNRLGGYAVDCSGSLA
jgi:hypothetical protein